MQFSKNWLYEWVKLKSSPYELSQKLTMAGLEVDGVSNVPLFSGVVVAQLQAIQAHPKSDKLSVCQLQTGGSDLVQVVTGADNLVQGDKLCFAPVGTHLPAIHKPNEKLEVADFKGEASHGMLLSSAEMGITDKAEGLFVLSQQAPIGEAIWEYLHLDDVIFDLDITPNRGDCLSIQGIAREIHALTKAEYSPIKHQAIAPVCDDELTVKLSADKACSRYCGRVIRQVDCSGSAPDWMKEKLRRSNIRSINPVVDIMNFIMIELGQPMHAFDLSKIQDVQVRMSKVGESLVLLDGESVTLDNESTVMIADSSQPLAIAGVMGGLDSAVTTQTTDIFLESAFFAPESIAGIGRQLGVHTDSSFRFERGVDPALQKEAIERATQWILDICGGEPGPVTDVSNEHLPVKQPIELSMAFAQQLLGYPLSVDDVIADLKRLGCEVSGENELFSVLPPTFRFDLNIQEDLIEEIARVKGYDNIEAILPHGICKPKTTSKVSESRIKRLFVDMGYQEAITYSFVDETLQNHFHDGQAVKLLNPITNDMNVMRASLWPGLVKAAAFNMHRQQPNLCLFETGLIFNQKDDNLIQKKVLGGLCSGQLGNPHWRSKASQVSFFDVKAHIEQLWLTTGKAIEDLSWQPCSEKALHPGQSAQIIYQDKAIGLIGAIHPKLEKALDLLGPVFVFEIDFDAIQSQSKIKFSKPSAYPAMRRDLSFVVSEKTTAAQISGWLKEEGGHMLKYIQIFDLYQGKGVPDGHKSMALGLTWQDLRRTLVDSDVDEVVNHLVQGLKQKFDAQLRD